MLIRKFDIFILLRCERACYFRDIARIYHSPAFFCVSFRASSWSLWALSSMSCLRALSALCVPPCGRLPGPAILRASYPNADETGNPSKPSTSNQPTSPLDLNISSPSSARALHLERLQVQAQGCMTPIVGLMILPWLMKSPLVLVTITAVFAVL
ncbi:hypothetical protein FIBSPDRAFT_1055633 [Athelia psychrophila]|uniref:Uncharacterized protein n=1 Tax=Athelia psychrophila TaxID=1759441 RepID=A0A167TCY9_9AGAM|nr:hypothetical protein FIBSPDRAFT_1055633 [Fibularhizoctonia sp. CBS 109695]